jgi:DNA-binding XRE family transcriptional regulator
MVNFPVLEPEFESFKIGLLLKKGREEKHLTQEQLAELVDKNGEVYQRGKATLELR